MNNATKLTLSALLAIFLTACDDKHSSSQLEQKVEKSAIQTSNESEKEKIENNKPIDTGEQDYKALITWQDTQEKALNDAIKTATDNLNQKQKEDTALMQQTVNKVLLTEIDSIKSSAENLNIQDTEVKALKDKTIDVLTLGTQMITEGQKMEQNPTPEAHKAFGELQTKLNQLAEEGQQLENKLRAKYAPAPAPAPAPQ